MIYFFIRNRKCRGLCLCMGLYGGDNRFQGLPVNRFNLFLFGWDLEANLNRIRLRVGQAYISSVRIISSAWLLRLFIAPTQVI